MHVWDIGPEKLLFRLPKDVHSLNLTWHVMCDRFQVVQKKKKNDRQRKVKLPITTQ